MASRTASVIVICAIVAGVNAGVISAEPKPDINAEWKAEQAAAKKAEGAAAAKQSKMAAVDKVVSMLEDLQLQVLAEGEAEAATYNKFACFCKTTQKEKTESIQTGQTDKSNLAADINKLRQRRSDLDTKISNADKDKPGLAQVIKKSEDDQRIASEKRAATLKEYTTNEADLSAGLASLTEAIEVLKSSNSPSMLEIQSISKTVKQAALMADALGLGGAGVQKAVGIFLQQGESSYRDVPVEMENYKFHSSGIIETLEKLLDDFRDEKASLDKDEVDSVRKFDLLIQDETDHVKAKTLEMEEAKQERDQKIEDIGTASQEHSTVSASLLDDMQYLEELNKVCSEKANTWDQRTKLRANELTALTQATGIVQATVSEKTQSATVRFAQTGTVTQLADAVSNSDSAMEAIEEEAEDSEDTPLGFLQKRSIQKHEPDAADDARQMIISLLSGKGRELKSTLLASLATQIAADPFTKIKKLIQELIERLLTEAANESNQKGWCDKATADATQKRQYAADKIEDLNADMAKLSALSAKLTEEIKTLKTEISELQDARSDATAARREETDENAHTVTEAKTGLEAINMAIDILDKFYKVSAKATVLSQTQGPLDDAPDAGFDNGEAYQGAAAESGGIIGMMEVIQSDFERTISETHKAEALAQKEYDEFILESRKSYAQKRVALTEKSKLRDEADEKHHGENGAQENLEAQVKILMTSIQELLELKAACIDTGMSYADRVAMREQEIASLKKALCILTAYAEYGPGGLQESC